MEDLRQENERLKQELEQHKKQISSLRLQSNIRSVAGSRVELKVPEKDAHLGIVVLGASGDLAKKKTYPSLFSLYGLGLLPENFTIYGFARSKMSHEEFRQTISKNFKGFDDKKEKFLERLFYFAGQYDSDKDFGKLSADLEKHESSYKHGHRVFYMAIPPSIFVEVANTIKDVAMAKNGWTRIIVEKPFGKDSASSAELSRQLAERFEEDQIFRIDHYLGKEMVQNLMVIRFANTVWEPVMNRHHVANVLITFKEDIGTEGRGGYFDQFGIIRDVMQNHLMQVLSLVAMEPPVSNSAEDIRDEKVKVLRSCSEIRPEDLVVGQFEGYKDDPQVPKDSVTPTFATAVIHINNPRWSGVPFMLKCGKGLNERKAEIRIQFKENNILFKNAPRNELVFRIQPNEAVYYKCNTKVPGLSEDIGQSELDLTYKNRFDVRLPDAYERLIYDVIRGDHNLFVRVDELEAAWNIFTPALHRLEREKVQPTVYKFGSRGPEQSDELLQKYGFERSEGYTWPQSKV